MKNGVDQGHQKSTVFKVTEKQQLYLYMYYPILYWYAGISMSLEDRFCRTIIINFTYLIYHKIVLSSIFNNVMVHWLCSFYDC